MKSCPTCNRTFDDTLTFCLIDGSVLSAPYDPESTLLYPHPRGAEPRETEVLTNSLQPAATIASSPPYPTVPSAPLPQYQPGTADHHRSRSHISKAVLVAVALLFVAIVAGGVIIANRSNWFSSNNYPPNKPSPDPTISNEPSALTSPTTTTPRNTPPTQPALSSQATPEIVKTMNMKGTWAGKSGTWNATIVVSHQEGNTFSGAKFIGDYQVAIVGDLDPASGRVTIRETRLLAGKSDYSLGVNTGKISNDGRTMSGNGRDNYSTYAWSYSKQ